MPPSAATERWASALLRLCALAGFQCAGSLEIGEDALAAVAADDDTATGAATGDDAGGGGGAGSRGGIGGVGGGGGGATRRRRGGGDAHGSAPSPPPRRLRPEGARPRASGGRQVRFASAIDGGAGAIPLSADVLRSPAQRSVANSPANLARARSSAAAYPDESWPATPPDVLTLFV